MKITLALAASLSVSSAFTAPSRSSRSLMTELSLTKPAGSFFNQVPEEDDDDDSAEKDKEPPQMPLSTDFEKKAALLLGQKMKAEAGGKSSAAGTGFGQPKKPYVALGPPDRKINDVTKPEYDKDGYTLYEDEKTGEKSRVFEALVEYPCKFTMKIVGAKEGTFVQDVVQTVAESCKVTPDEVPFSTREMGKWTSVTVEAPVESAEMLYLLYENVDKDPRVKFKF